ncbi:MAG TPA: DUF554 family protein, partial [Desulfopila sp.]|nr:DUF554 family protein [Desulfopila sp.]
MIVLREPAEAQQRATAVADGLFRLRYCKSVRPFRRKKEMILQGTLVNIAAVIGGCAVGHFAGRHISAPLRRTMMAGLGLAVLLIGLQLALQGTHILIIIASLITGGIIGELVGIERHLRRFSERLQERFASHGSIAEGFVTASLLYCVGAMAIMGALQDGVGETPTIL